MTQTPALQLDFEAAAQMIRAAQNIIIVTHVNPDGDAIGSMCGLGLALREMGKSVVMAVDGGIDDYLSYVPASETVLSALPPTSHADLVISCDASDLERTGEVGAFAFGLGLPSLVIDHHATNTLFGTAHILNSDFVSTTEAVLHLLDHLGHPISLEIAKALLIGFMTDTMGFRVGPVTPLTLAQVAQLLKAGADLDLREVLERMLVRVEPYHLQILGIALARLKLEEYVIWTHLTLEDMAQFGLSASNTPEVASELMRDSGAYIAAFFREIEDGTIRLSLRATPGFDIGSIAFELGGGGHTLAAGATLPDASIHAAIERVIPLLKAEAQRGQAIYK